MVIKNQKIIKIINFAGNDRRTEMQTIPCKELIIKVFPQATVSYPISSQ